MRPKGLEITEEALSRFRAERLSSRALLQAVEEHVQVLLRLGVGVGKSFAADRLLADPETYRRFGLVLYTAPSWDILNERRVVSRLDKAPVPWTIVRPRPVESCGDYAERWSVLEGQGCAAYAKAALCRACQKGRRGSDRCFWPGQFASLKDHRLIFATEQQLLLNRALIPILKARSGAGRVLVILDEARLLDTSFEVTLAPDDLERFLEAVRKLTRPRGIPRTLGDEWRRGIEFLLEAESRELTDARFSFPPGLNKLAYKIQDHGLKTFDRAFRYLGYDLTHLQWSRGGERWKDSSGVVRFTARPYLGCHLLLLSAHLGSDYVAHRLGRASIASPFERVRFRHTGTRILNLRSRIGADSYFPKNHRQILDTFAVLILRNVLRRRSTLLVSRKKSKGFSAEYLHERLEGWGLEVRFLTEGYDALPERPDPGVIPVIHYGILGVNDFSEYESAYCLNSYYVSTEELNRHVQDAEPEEFRVPLKIVSGPGPEVTRRAELAERGKPDQDHTLLGNLYLRKLEVDPVVQTAGRVRFLTRAREVVFFQMHTLSADIGPCEDVRTLLALRRVLGVPSAREIDHRLEGRRGRALMDDGLTAGEAARRLGLSRRTFFRRLERSRVPFFLDEDSYRKNGTLPAGGEGVR